MKFQETKEMVSRIICGEFARRGITVKMLILFGSQVRGTPRPDSDWDFLAVTDRTVNWPEKREIWHSLSLVLAKDRNDKGKVTYYAQKEGVVL